MSQLSLIGITTDSETVCFINPAHIISVYVDKPGYYIIELTEGIQYVVKTDSTSGHLIRNLLRIADASAQILAYEGGE